MQPRFKWRWAYLPVILLMGFIWYEFWTSSSEGEVASHDSPAPQIATMETAPATLAVTTAPTTQAQSAEPPEPPMDPFVRLLKEPPPISVKLEGATLKEAIDAVRQSLGSDAVLTFNSGQPTKPITIDAREQPFWDVIKSIQAQCPFDFQDGGKGLVAQGYGAGVRQFERRGPAILFATSFMYIRQGTGQGKPGDAGSPPRYNLTLGAAIDPRLHILRHSNIMALQAYDETGQQMDVSSNNSTNFNVNESNFWMQGLSWPAPEKPGKRCTIECMFRYTAQSGEMTVALEDAENKIDKPFDFGDRRLSLARLTVQQNRLTYQLAAADEQGDLQKMSVTITDGAGTSYPPVQGLSGNLIVAGGPFKFSITGPKTKDMTVKIDLRDLPLP